MSTTKKAQVIIVDCIGVAPVDSITAQYLPDHKLKVITPTSVACLNSLLTTVIDDDKQIIVYFYGYCDVDDDEIYFLHIGDDCLSAYDFAVMFNVHRGQGMSTIMFVTASWKKCLNSLMFSRQKILNTVIYLITPFEYDCRDLYIDLKSSQFIPNITEIIMDNVKNITARQKFNEFHIAINEAIENQTQFPMGTLMTPGVCESVMIDPL